MSLVFSVICKLTGHSVLNSACFEPHMFIIQLQIQILQSLKICILMLYTCTAATRRPRMTTSDFMVYDSAVKLAAHKTRLKVFIPSSLWNLQLIIMWLYHFKRKIRLKIHTPFITNLSVSIFKSVGKQKSCTIQAE